jgi:microcystin-dependent protein
VTEQFLGEIRMMSFAYAPSGWALCNGAVLPINQNQALFSLLGTTFGGDGVANFGLPNLQGRTPIHVGNGQTIGQQGGETTHTLSMNEIPGHGHAAQASSGSGAAITRFGAPFGALLAQAATRVYHAPTNPVAMNPETITISSGGEGQPHENMQPYLTISFCIALYGIVPVQS